VLDFFNSTIHYDKQSLIFLNSQGSAFWDGFWLFITNPIHWIPFYILLLLLSFKSFGIKKVLLILLFTALSAASALLIVNLIKNIVQRVRPLNDPSINTKLRILIEANDFSFPSGHSTVSFTIAFLSYWVLKNSYKYPFLVFLFPILFAYSRVYLAAHFPLDILTGMLLGFLIAKVFYKIMQKIVFKRITTLPD